MNKNQIRYTVACVSEFAKMKKITQQEAFRYLYNYKAIDFLVEFYDVEHTLSFDEVVEDLTLISQKNGGNIQ